MALLFRYYLRFLAWCSILLITFFVGTVLLMVLAFGVQSYFAAGVDAKYSPPPPSPNPIKATSSDRPLYQALGFAKITPPSSITFEEIKNAYRQLVMQFHPDRQVHASDRMKKEAAVKIKDITFAYDILSDPERWAIYDATGSTKEKQL